MSSTPLCYSRRAGEICTRRRGHPGLHNRVGRGILWSERDADPPRCPGSGRAATAAARLADGWPDGRAVCDVCLGFVALADGVLLEHDAWRGGDAATEAERRREWFNTHGW